MTTKSFHLGDVLTITTGYMVSPNLMSGIYGILNHMTGDNLFTHQLPRAMDECAPYLLKQFPQLAEVVYPIELEDRKEILVWLNEKVEKYGENFYVVPIPKDEHTVIDPIAELKMMTPDMPILTIDPATGEIGSV